ncbi:pre-mRNA-splicing factor slt11 [Tothia fuscella]|uniref:Pre-mRNA-splicing factor slt11 n=1 Tax=Tothia fuscella TaxID=1048955 RepID=A0A9P4TYZ4_9PEZI|nr:pre-mRNA-splicing factor slt11 [Tothia fuscella]
MPPQIKQDLNRSGWETTDFPSVCERCLPENPYVQMLKEDHGAECKICSRPFTVFRFKADRTSRQKRTNICLTCARLKNCCQVCMLDLSFGLPIVVRDAALKMVAPGPTSDINKQYYAQENEKEIEEGRGAVEAYEKTDEKARELLRRLANSEPYYKKQRRMDVEAEESGNPAQKALPPAGSGPIRPRDSKMGGALATRGGSRGGRGGARGGRVFPGTAQLAPRPEDILPPSDTHITSLFITGVEDDLPEHELRTYFTKFGTLRSVICSHRSHCAFMNFQTRAGAEAAAEACQGRAVVKGVPLRVQWGKPKPLDTMDKDQRMVFAREGRGTGAAGKHAAEASQAQLAGAAATDDLDSLAIAAPPGAEDIEYASLAGN